MLQCLKLWNTRKGQDSITSCVPVCMHVCFVCVVCVHANEWTNLVGVPRHQDVNIQLPLNLFASAQVMCCDVLYV